MASFEPQDHGLDEPPPRPTTPPVRRGFLLVLVVLCLAASLVYGIPHMAEQTGYSWESGRSRAASEALAKLDKAGVVNRASELFRMATVAVSPAVVNIQTQRLRHENNPGQPGALAPFGGGPRFDRGDLETVGIGSGVIIDRQNGYVVTNNHVINNADKVIVRLSQGAEVSARVVGADPKTDLAVLQIKGQTVKVAAEWGDSDKLASGDWVLAIGSPFMLDHTVTAGIVSATGRNNLALPGMDESAYQDFIQTDAAINPGNSGGPLIDLNGKVIGINTAILTSSSYLRGDDGAGVGGGFEGIGLAIPSSMARRIVNDLIKKGKVERGFLGIVIQPLTPALAQTFKLPPDIHGALVDEVKPGGPADKAGIKLGDVIVSIGGKETPDRDAVRNRIAEAIPGTQAVIAYYREGAKATTSVAVGELSAASLPAVTEFGFRVREVPTSLANGARSMVFIDQVVRGSPAAHIGLRPGLRVLAVGKTEVNTLAEFEKAAAAFTPEGGLPLRIQFRDGQSTFVTVGGPGGGSG